MLSYHLSCVKNVSVPDGASEARPGLEADLVKNRCKVADSRRSVHRDGLVLSRDILSSLLRDREAEGGGYAFRLLVIQYGVWTKVTVRAPCEPAEME